MANDYPADPRDLPYVNDSSTPQSGQGSVGSGESPHASSGGQAVPSTSAGQAGGRNLFLKEKKIMRGEDPSTPAGQSSSRQPLSPGTRLWHDRYTIEKLVAAGGMGAVYLAIDVHLDGQCAVKEMLDNFHSEEERAQSVEWFKREAKLLLNLNHPCIPRVRDFFDENGRRYLVMDFINGRTLAQAMEQEGNVVGVNGARGVSEALARNWAQQICNVLAYLHRQTPPIIFRDLKPSNVMITQSEEIKLIDFGIARTFQSQRQSTIIMTPGYAPPEQLAGRPEPRSDLYALGATLHKLLTRHDAANNQPHFFSFPPLRSLRPDISPAFEQIVMKALAPNPEQRWTSALEMERAIMALPPLATQPPSRSLWGSAPPSVAGPGSGPGGTANPASSPTPSSTPTTGTGGPAGRHIMAARAHLAANPARVEPAYEETRLAYGLEPNNALVHKLFGQVYARRVPPQADIAIKAYNRSLELNPNDAETHRLVGDVLLYILNQPQHAVPAYTQSLRLNAGDAEARQRLGLCYERTGQLESALREYQEAARLAPKNPAIQYALGQVAMRLNQLPIAEQAFVQVLFSNPGDHQTRFLLSQVYERENKLEDAFRECGYVVGHLSANPAVQQMYQRLRTRLGR
ncbi:MAG: protein kinase [Ktedonobacteraceae bacterium]|nr:protein kinase [Ktedonobacteraceae bacterium]